MAKDWRWRVLNRLGPGGYPGFLAGDWLRLLRDNRYSVAPAYWIRAASACVCSLANSTIAAYERRRYQAEWEAIEIQPPIFILGHWRSGTTHLHQLLATDERFAFPSLYHVGNPHTFLSTESTSTRLSRFLLPRQRAFDNVRQTWEMPNEDEIATAMLTLRSPYLTFLFPDRAEFYDRYLSFRDVAAAEIDQWRSGVVLFLKKLTWKYRRPLILKSPPHTCRIRLLLELFPTARFVHIHRAPFRVFQSSMHLVNKTLGLLCFQRSDTFDWQARTLRLYREMYDVFFEQRALIPAGQYHEVCFEELERDPLEQLRSLYESLYLPDFAVAQPKVTQYLDSIAGYKKNQFPELTTDMRALIASKWRPCFEAWGYPT